MHVTFRLPCRTFRESCESGTNSGTDDFPQRPEPHPPNRSGSSRKRKPLHWLRPTAPPAPKPNRMRKLLPERDRNRLCVLNRLRTIRLQMPRPKLKPISALPTDSVPEGDAPVDPQTMAGQLALNGSLREASARPRLPRDRKPIAPTWEAPARPRLKS